MAINTNYESSKDVPGGALLDTECLWFFCHIAIDERQSGTGIFGGRNKRERMNWLLMKNQIKMKRKHKLKKLIWEEHTTRKEKGPQNAV